MTRVSMTLYKYNLRINSISRTHLKFYQWNRIDPHLWRSPIKISQFEDQITTAWLRSSQGSDEMTKLFCNSIAIYVDDQRTVWRLSVQSKIKSTLVNVDWSKMKEIIFVFLAFSKYDKKVVQK